MKRTKTIKLLIGGWRSGSIYGDLYTSDGPWKDSYRPYRAPSTVLPPLDPKIPNQIDVLPFLLADSVIMDESTFSWLQEERSSQFEFPRLSAESKKILKLLKEENIIELKNFQEILRTYDDVLQQMEIDDKRDDRNLNRIWQNSIKLWAKFIIDVAADYGEKPTSISLLADGFQQMLRRREKFFTASTAIKKHSYDEEVKLGYISKGAMVAYDTLEWSKYPFINHIRDVNRTLLLSNIFNVEFYDWFDYQPFYKYKFSRLGLKAENISEANTTKKIIELYLPEVRFENPEAVLRWREKGAILRLREFIHNTRYNESEIKKDILLDIQQEILSIENKIEKVTKIVSYLTLPLEIIPNIGTLLSKITEEAANMLIRKILRKDYQWHYFLRSERQRVKLGAK